MKRKFNFNPGPATLPLVVLEELQKNIVELNNLGMSVLEISHRSGEFGEIMQSAKSLLRDLMRVPDEYEILFLGGGASLQFAMVPINLLRPGEIADYVITGSWSKKAIKEAKIVRDARVCVTGEEEDFRRIPDSSEIKISPDAKYIHITSNNTIFGTQWRDFPETNGVPLVADMSSDILSRVVDVSRFGLIYAGAQKNLGPAGVTVIIIRKDLAERCPESTPAILRYKTHIEKDSLYNTPPVFAIYAVKLVLEWLKEAGGVEAVEEVNKKKAALLYEVIDGSGGFYRTTVDPDSRSMMNVVFRLKTEELETRFVQEAASSGLHGLKGHRSVGGLRASIYNAFPIEGVERLVDFMHSFAKANQ
jgi:phosphoserine aminotransferase